MVILYDILKTLFFLLTLVVGIFYIRGRDLVQGQMYEQLFTFLMPGYLLFCGLMIGYLIAHIREYNTTAATSQSMIYIRSFIIGIILGLVLSFGYMLV